MLSLVQKLYKIEREINGADECKKVAVRQEQSLPILTELEEWLAIEQPKLLPKSPAPEALNELLPDRWLKANPQHVWRINQARQKKS